MQRVLEGIKILDLTRVLAGPFCTMILADLGAEVIKVEEVDKGDDFRSLGPFINDESVGFMSLNRNKKSITLDLRSERGNNIFRGLVPKFDIMTENFRPGTMKKLGLGYEVLNEINPRIIYASISGFGQTGPYAFKSAYDFIISGYSGILSISAHPGGEPIRVGIGLVDMAGGLFAAIAILGALRAREITGKGARIDISLLDSVIALLENPVARFFAAGQNPAPTGNQHPFMAPMGVYPTSDGYMIIAVGNQSLWKSFCEAIHRGDLFDNPEFSTNTKRIKNLSELRVILGDVLRLKSTSEWLEIFDQAGVPCGPLNTIKDAVNDAYVKHRNMIFEFDHPIAGLVKICGTPIKIEGIPDSIMHRPPLLGEHTKEVLKNYSGLTEEEINKLKADKII